MLPEKHEERIKHILTYAVNEYNYYLLNGKKTIEALQHLIIKRGLTTNDIRSFRLGYCPPNSRFILSRLLKLGFTQEEVIESGLIHKSTLKDVFGGYIVIPNIIKPLTYGYEREFDVVHITGRYVGKQTDNIKKHLHINGSIGHLFNINSYDANYKYSIIVESPLDAIILSSQLNMKNIFANYGALVKGKHVYDILQNKSIYIVFDTDKTGEKEALNLANFFWRTMKNNAYIVSLSMSGNIIEKEDITDFLIKTQQSFRVKLKEIFNKAILYTETNHYKDFIANSMSEPTKKPQSKPSVDNDSRRIQAKAYPITNLIEHFIPGNKWKTNKICCPFHGEKIPSFTIFPEENRFYCFGCGVRGDTIDFVRMMGDKEGKNINFLQAIDFILNL